MDELKPKTWENPMKLNININPTTEQQILSKRQGYLKMNFMHPIFNDTIEVILNEGFWIIAHQF